MTGEFTSVAADRENTTAWSHLAESAPRHVSQRMADHAIENFSMLGPVESPHENLRTELESVIIDQPAAIEAIIDVLDQAEARVGEDTRPIANLAFLGPSGVGKSETAKMLACLLGDDNLIKIDCSNFTNGHEVTMLTGAPPSYVGRDQKSPLSKDRVEQPNTVILFDEIEKGAPELYNLMLQIMNDGELCLNNTGEVVSFKSAIVIMTSNLGAKEMATRLTGTPLGFGSNKNQATDKESLEIVANQRFEEFFAPEFIGRIDRQIVFHPLSAEGLSRVLDTKIALANTYYEPQYGIRISLSEATKSHLIDIAAQQPHLGARPVVRAFEDEVKTTFGRYISTGRIPESSHVRVFSQEELPAGHGYGSDPLVFGAMRDISIRKLVPPRVVVQLEPRSDRQEDVVDGESNDEENE